MTKRKVKNKQPSEKWKKYIVSGTAVQRKPSCPKCGPGYFLAEHTNRFYCGKCHFVQMK
ncbi:MAG: 30S ribosomal protein S27ae [Nanoarchaeota archaeon]